MFPRILLSFVFLAGFVYAQSAMLECTADSIFYPRGREAFLMQFRVGPAAKTQIKTAQIFLHVESGAVPASVELALVERPWTEATAKSLKPPTAWRPAEVKKQPKGWVAIQIPTNYAQSLMDGKAHGIAMRGGFRPHQRESVQFAPYLNVEGAK